MIESGLLHLASDCAFHLADLDIGLWRACSVRMKTCFAFFGVLFQLAKKSLLSEETDHK